MKHRFISVALTAAVLLLGASLSFALENKADATQGAGSNAKAVPKSDKREIDAKRKAAAKVKLVDINGATSAELKKLPGISNAEAHEIIAGRPYLSKADLVTHNIVSPGVYENLKKLVIAKQNQATAAKLREMQKAH
jgi:DNA uptake protein ComE-like DNA-binding protein